MKELFCSCGTAVFYLNFREIRREKDKKGRLLITRLYHCPYCKFSQGIKQSAVPKKHLYRAASRRSLSPALAA